MYKVVVLADSVAPNGSRLFTVEATYPRFVHSELMTHRQFSRNAASSRAIPVEKTLARVWDEPATPISWGKNQKGMQAEEELLGVDLGFARSYWTEARNKAAQQADKMVKMGVHKQIVNRLLEPFVWMTTIISATDWANFFALRCHRDAQPEIREIADRIRYAYSYHSPTPVPYGCWHLPLVTREERQTHPRRELCALSTARCARVSYLTHDGRRDLQADFDLHDRLASAGHWSPFEHVATPTAEFATRSGNFRGWRQYRRDFAFECKDTYEHPAEDDWKNWRVPPKVGEDAYYVWEE